MNHFLERIKILNPELAKKLHLSENYGQDNKSDRFRGEKNQENQLPRTYEKNQ